MKLLINEMSIRMLFSRRIKLLQQQTVRKGSLPIQAAYSEGTAREGTRVSSSERLRCIKMFVSLVSDILSGCDVKRSVFRPTSDDWTAQLVLLYIFQYVSVDKALTRDSYLSSSCITPSSSRSARSSGPVKRGASLPAERSTESL